MLVTFEDKFQENCQFFKKCQIIFINLGLIICIEFITFLIKFNEINLFIVMNFK